MRPLLFALCGMASGALVLTQCASFESAPGPKLDDAGEAGSDGDAATTPDAPPVVDAGTDRCPGAIFCDDFDDYDGSTAGLLTNWTLSPSGISLIAPGNPPSPAFALRTQLAADPTDAGLVKSEIDHDEVQTVATNVRFEFDMNLVQRDDPLVTTIYAQLDVGDQAFYFQSGVNAFVLGWRDGSGTQKIVLSYPNLALGSWAHLRLDFTNTTTPPTVAAYVDANAMNGSPYSVHAVNGSKRNIHLLVAGGAPRGAIDVLYDNALLTTF